MSVDDPRAVLSAARRVVIKVGSQLISDSPAGRPAAIADEIASLQSAPGESKASRQFVVVSSGSIALGCRVLGITSRPHELPTLQAAAAVGQNRLMQNWEHAFRTHRVPIGQVLLTHDDLGDRRRFLNARHALRALLDRSVIPVINENDTVAVEEIKYGDNDLLAALVCNLISADALIMLTDVDGLCDAPPDAGGKRIALVRDVDREATPVATTGRPDGLGSGGMASKVQAAKAAARHGVASAVVAGHRSGILRSTLSGADVGTLFIPPEGRISSRKHWIAYGPRPRGTLVVDSGAHQALVERGRSLLSAGISEVSGSFELGEIVSLLTQDGIEFARGLAGYSSADLKVLKGKHSADIEATLGYKYLDEVIHRDDLVLL